MIPSKDSGDLPVFTTIGLKITTSIIAYKLRETEIPIIKYKINKHSFFMIQCNLTFRPRRVFMRQHKYVVSSLWFDPLISVL